MYSENVIVDYKGFSPTEDTASELRVLTDQLQEEAPSESSLNATFSKEWGDPYEGSIRINFSEGSFFAQAEDHDLLTLIKKIVHRLREQLIRWKTVRFNQSARIEGDLSYGTSH